MDKAKQILSDITVFQKYAKHIPSKNRRESWEELVQRNMEMHLKKFPELEYIIRVIYEDFVLPKKILPSMRSLQFGGRPIELANNRMFNCAFLPAEHEDFFAETMFLLLGGSGVGYSVQHRHVDKLPIVLGVSKKQRKFLVGDSIEGWADAVKVLMQAYFHHKHDPVFDFRDIRNKGAKLITSGGKAPGPDPLRICLDHIRATLNNAVGRKLIPLEVHDIACHIADAVLSGGIRRAAMISLFDKTDMDMMTCKAGDWWELNPQRGRANNSVILDRADITKKEFDFIWQRVKDSGAGEPGIYWTNNLEWGTNPCVEIGLRPYQFCNLVEIGAASITSQEMLENRVEAATILGTLQATYTDFHYLRPIWKETTEKDALLGVSMTGIASGTLANLDLVKAVNRAKEVNKDYAEAIGINPSARITAVKPAGTTSLVLGSSSGIHAWHNDFYIRRMRVGKNEALYKYMKEHIPSLIEDCKHKPHLEAVMSFPQKAPEGATTRQEKYLDLLERVKKYNVQWVKPGHVDGDNSHNVSCTISLKPEEWSGCGNWMWDNREYYSGISVLPYDGGTYVQPPFEDCDEATYNKMYKALSQIDLTKVIEIDDNTSLSEQAACSGGTCEI